MVDLAYLDQHSERIQQRRDEEATSHISYLQEQGELLRQLDDTRGCANRMEIVGRMFENIGNNGRRDINAS